MANKLRSFFPYIQKSSRESNHIYFDSASSSHKPNNVIEAIKRFYEEDYSNINRSYSKTTISLEEKIKKAKENICRFINSPSPDNIIFTSGTTEGINMVSSCYVQNKLRKGDTIVITELEHNSNFLPWVSLSRSKDLNLVVIPVDSNGSLRSDILFEELEKRPSFLAITHKSNITGEILPIDKICNIAKGHGTITLVDAAQSVGHSRMDVQDINSDFLVFSGHKIYGPTGIGVLYASDNVIGDMNPYKLGGGMVEVIDESYNYRLLEKSALFEAGTMNLSGIIGLSAAIDFIEDNYDEIVQIEREVSSYLWEALSTMEGVKCIGNLKSTSNIFSFNIDGIHHYDLGSLLDVKNITIRTGMNCAHLLHYRTNLQDGSARVSLGCYNTLSEAERFIRDLKGIIKKYGSNSN